MSQARYVLEIQPIGGDAERHTINREVTVVGRTTGDLVIPEKGASGRHLEIRFDGRDVVVQDLNSTNGTLYRDTLHREAFKVPVGGMFQVGRTQFRVVEVHTPPPPKPAAPEPADLGYERTAAFQPAWEDADEAPEKTAFLDAPPAQPARATAGPKPTDAFDSRPIREAAARQAAEEVEEKTSFLAADEAPTMRPSAVPPGRGAAYEEEVEEKTSFLAADEAPTMRPGAGEVRRTVAFEAEPMREASRRQAAEEVEEKTSFLAADEPPRRTAPPPQDDRPRIRPRQAEPAEKTQWRDVLTGEEQEAPAEKTRWGDAIPEAPRQPEPPAWEEEVPADTGGPDWASAYMQGGAPPTARAARGGVPTGGSRPTFEGTGLEAMKEMIVGALLTAITFGIYGPWFFVKLRRWMAARTTFGPTRGGFVQLAFVGQGGQLFVKFLVGYLLTLVTLGIYGAWFACDLGRFFVQNTEGRAEDGTYYQAQFSLTGGQLFVKALVGYLLTMITFGIYAPWFICSMQRLFKQHTFLYANGQHVGSFEFDGEGGSLFVVFIVGYLLTLVTLGVYGAWWQVKLKRYFLSHTVMHTTTGASWRGGFAGSGGELFVIFLVGFLLMPISLGFYGFWLWAKIKRFNLNHQVWSAA